MGNLSTATAEDTMKRVFLILIFSYYFGTLDACWGPPTGNPDRPIHYQCCRYDPNCTVHCGDYMDYENIIEDEAEITKEELHKFVDDNLQLSKIPGFTEDDLSSSGLQCRRQR